MGIEEALKERILKNYGNVQAFCDAYGLKYTTIVTMLKRGVHNANIDNVIAMCNALNISADALAENRIEERDKPAAAENDLAAILENLIIRVQTDTAMTFDGLPVTKWEVGTTKKSIEFMLSVMRAGRETRHLQEYADLYGKGSDGE